MQFQSSILHPIPRSTTPTIHAFSLHSPPATHHSSSTHLDTQNPRMLLRLYVRVRQLVWLTGDTRNPHGRGDNAQTE